MIMTTITNTPAPMIPCPYCFGAGVIGSPFNPEYSTKCSWCKGTLYISDRRAPAQSAQSSQEAMETARRILAASPAILGQRNHRDLVSGIAAALTATHAKAEAEGYARGIDLARKEAIDVLCYFDCATVQYVALHLHGFPCGKLAEGGEAPPPNEMVWPSTPPTASSDE